MHPCRTNCRPSTSGSIFDTTLSPMPASIASTTVCEIFSVSRATPNRAATIMMTPLANTAMRTSGYPSVPKRSIPSRRMGARPAAIPPTARKGPFFLARSALMTAHTAKDRSAASGGTPAAFATPSEKLRATSSRGSEGGRCTRKAVTPSSSCFNVRTLTRASC